jgi:hypothetical protein
LELSLVIFKTEQQLDHQKVLNDLGFENIQPSERVTFGKPRNLKVEFVK